MRPRLPRFEQNLGLPCPIHSENLGGRPGKFRKGNLDDLAATNERRKNAEGASKIGPKHTHNATLLFLCSRTFDAVAVLIARSRLNQNMKGEYLLVRHDVAIAAPGPTDCHLI
jgi:hypothetical protein